MAQWVATWSSAAYTLIRPKYVRHLHLYGSTLVQLCTRMFFSSYFSCRSGVIAPQVWVAATGLVHLLCQHTKYTDWIERHRDLLLHCLLCTIALTAERHNSFLKCHSSSSDISRRSQRQSILTLYSCTSNTHPVDATQSCHDSQYIIICYYGNYIYSWNCNVVIAEERIVVCSE